MTTKFWTGKKREKETPHQVAKQRILKEIRGRGAACLSRYSMESGGLSIATLRRAAQELSKLGQIQKASTSRDTYVRP